MIELFLNRLLSDEPDLAYQTQKFSANLQGLSQAGEADGGWQPNQGDSCAKTTQGWVLQVSKRGGLGVNPITEDEVVTMKLSAVRGISNYIIYVVKKQYSAQQQKTIYDKDDEDEK